MSFSLLIFPLLPLRGTTWANVAEPTPVQTTRFEDAGRVTALQSVIATDLVRKEHFIV